MSLREAFEAELRRRHLERLEHITDAATRREYLDGVQRTHGLAMRTEIARADMQRRIELERLGERLRREGGL